MTEPKAKIGISAEDKASPVIRKLVGEMQTIRTGATGLQSVMGALGLAVGGAFSVVAVAGFARQMAVGVDRLNDLTDATGASVEKMSGLEDLMARTGNDVDEAADAIIKLNKALNDAQADPESSAGRAFKALGLDIKELKRLDPVDMFQRVAQAINGFADGGEKGRFMVELLGKSTKALAAAIKDVGEAGQINATLTSQQAQEYERLNKEIAAFNKNLLDMSRSIAGPVVTTINQLIDRWTALRAAGGFFSSVGKEVKANLLTDELNNAVFELESVQRRMDFGEQGLERRRDALRTYIRDIQSQLLKATADIKGFANAVDPQEYYSNEGRNYPKPTLPDISGKGDKGKKTKDISLGDSPVSQAVTDALQAIGQTDVVKVQQINAALDQLFSMRASGLGGGAELDQAIENLRNQLQQLNPAARAAAEQKKRLDDALEVSPDSPFNQMLDDLQALEALLAAGKINVDQFNAAAEKIKSPILRAANDAKETSKTIGEEIGLVFSSAAGDAIRQWTGVRNLLKGVLLDLAQIALKKTVTEPLSKEIGKIDFKEIGSSVLQFLFGGGRAGGGSVVAGRFYRINENDGPGELFNVGGRQYLMARQNGRVEPQGVQASAPSGTNHFHFHLPPGSNPDDWRRSSRGVAVDLQRKMRLASGIA